MVCFQRKRLLIDHNESRFDLELGGNLQYNPERRGWWGFDELSIAILADTETEEFGECPGTECLSTECQAPGSRDTAELLGYCDPRAGCKGSRTMTALDRSVCDIHASQESSGSTCIPPPTLFAPGTNEGSCKICDGDFQCVAAPKFAQLGL